MYRQALRACPACVSPMQPVQLVLGAAEMTWLDVCGACGAGFFDYFAGELAQLARMLLRRDAAPAIPAHVHRLRDPSCPDCEDGLTLAPYLDDGPLLYRCDGCLSAFVTARQLRLLAEYEYTQKASSAVLRAFGERLGFV